jgi:NAD(P)-dependent dehydrogenase (short-subunit alcohol dehydrogenase family)
MTSVEIAAAPPLAPGRALVTGGASGIGLALARGLIAHGWRVAIADLDSPTARAAAVSLGADWYATDLRDPNASGALIAAASAKEGAPDLVCSNAGVSRNKRLRKEPLGEAARDLFEVNVFAALRLAQAYSAILETAARPGRLLITGSENSLSAPKAVQTFGLGLYAASKHAVLALAEWLAIENAGGRLQVHILLPGPVYSPLVAATLPDPTQAPPGFDLISCEACAEIALRGLALNLTYIPTHAHIASDMDPRLHAIRAATIQLGLKP